MIVLVPRSATEINSVQTSDTMPVTTFISCRLWLVTYQEIRGILIFGT